MKIINQQPVEQPLSQKKDQNFQKNNSKVEIIKKISNEKIVISSEHCIIKGQENNQSIQKTIQEKNKLENNVKSKIKLHQHDMEINIENNEWSSGNNQNNHINNNINNRRKFFDNDTIKFIKKDIFKNIIQDKTQDIQNFNSVLNLLKNKPYEFINKKSKNLHKIETKNTKNNVLTDIDKNKSTYDTIYNDAISVEKREEDQTKYQIFEFLKKEKQKILSLLNKVVSSYEQQDCSRKEKKVSIKKSRFSTKSVLTKDIEEKEIYFKKRSVSSYFIYDEYVPVYQKENLQNQSIKKLARVIYEHNPEYIGTLYKIRFALLPSDQIYNLASPEHVLPVEHDEKREENKKKVAEEYIRKFNETVGFYEKLEKSILSEGIRNPIIVVSGEPRVVSSDLIDKEYIEKTPYEKRLYCEQLGGSRLYIFQKYGWYVPCIICDWTGGFSEYMELKTPEEINQFFIDKTQIYFTHKGLKVLPPLHIHLDEDNRSPELMSKIRKEFFDERKNK